MKRAGVLGSILASALSVVVFVCAELRQSWVVAQVALVVSLVGAIVIGRQLWRTNPKAVSDPADDVRTGTFRKLLVFTALGIAAIVLYAIRFNNWKEPDVARLVSVGILTAGAAFITGALTGFLFGVPRSRRQSSQSTTPTAPDKASSADQRSGAQTADRPGYDPNTNLEEISDWLTKTIVGVGLVQLHKMPPLVWKLAEAIGGAMGSAAETTSLALIIIIYFSTAGFLLGYLWTRLDLTTAFTNSLNSIIDQRLDDDASAMAMVDRWLNQPMATNDGEAQAKMMEAIKHASSAAKIQIFLNAERERRSCARHAADSADARRKDQEANERALPVFEALVVADDAKVFHRNRSQYALALMKKSNPDFRQALELLSEAIRIRDTAREPGWKDDELARAVCRIQLDSASGVTGPSAPDLRKAIDADLSAANSLTEDQRHEIDPGDAIVEAWRRRNPSP